MQSTSALYKRLLAAPHVVETRLTVGDSGRLIDNIGNAIIFGGFGILVADSSADSGYAENVLISVNTYAKTFKDEPSVGNAISAEIDVEMMRPKTDLPVRARVVPYVTLSNGEEHSEWLQKGVFFIDTREATDDNPDTDRIHIHGYDAMIKAEADYPASKLSWPAKDIDVVKEIAAKLDVSIDKRTYDLMKSGYRINFPADYSMREVLGYIAGMYGANCIMTDLGELLIIGIFDIPAETRYLTDENGFSISFGGDRILV